MSKLIVAFITLISIPLFAQTTSFQGAVSDGQGALTPGAIVSLKKTDTGAQRQSITDDRGEFNFSQVQPGEYRVEATKPGFRTFGSSVRLQVDTPSTLSIRLELGTVSEVVNVEAVATVVNTQNATMGNPFTEVQVKGLPLQTRNVVELLILQPGVTSTGNVMGARNDHNNVTLDGVDVNNTQTGNVSGTGSTSTGFKCRASGSSRFCRRVQNHGCRHQC